MAYDVLSVVAIIVSVAAIVVSLIYFVLDTEDPRKLNRFVYAEKYGVE